MTRRNSTQTDPNAAFAGRAAQIAYYRAIAREARAWRGEDGGPGETLLAGAEEVC